MAELLVQSHKHLSAHSPRPQWPDILPEVQSCWFLQKEAQAVPGLQDSDSISVFCVSEELLKAEAWPPGHKQIRVRFSRGVQRGRAALVWQPQCDQKPGSSGFLPHTCCARGFCPQELQPAQGRTRGKGCFSEFQLSQRSVHTPGHTLL